MKIVETPHCGPMFRFNDATVYWALHTLSDGRMMGRKKLADAVGTGEGSMRKIIKNLKEWNFIHIVQTGITLTKEGKDFLEKIPVRVVDIDLGNSIVGEFTQGVVVMGVADKIHNGMQQRDAGIKAGASGCTTVVIRNGSLMIPPDWNIDEENPELANKIREKTEMTPNDILIVAGGDSYTRAAEAAINAAFELI